jgi:murein DD-endopeptidase MepM/ murein hydrolase activator NlpD
MRLTLAALVRLMPVLAVILLAGTASARCALPPPPEPAMGPAAENATRLPMAVSSLVFHLNGSAIYPVTGTDGKLHVTFDVTMTNASAFATTISAVEVLDAGSRAVIGPNAIVSMNGKDLSKSVFLFSKRDPLDDKSLAEELAAGASGSMFFDVALPPDARLPPYLTLQVTALLATGEAYRKYVVTGQPMPVSCDLPIRLSPPLAGPGWVNGNGCCALLSLHRWALQPIFGRQQPPEQFAIDFVRIGPDGTVYKGAIADIASWPYYGVAVLAAAAGTVVEAVDTMEDGTPGQNPPATTAETAAGNHLIIDMGEGRYALYAHLKPKSLRVKVGDRVEGGETIAQLGNTGNSDGPHLHFQVMDRPSALDATGLPFVFNTMTLSGRLSGTGNAAIDGIMDGKPAILNRDSRGDRRETMPLMLDVVDFP